MKPNDTQPNPRLFTAKKLNSTARKGCAAVFGLAFLASSAGYGQVSSINSVYMDPRVFDDVPTATYTGVDSYPGLVSLSEANVTSSTGFANRDVWYFSNNGGTSAYQFQNNDYFNASFSITLTGGTPNYDIEAGWLFSNPSGNFGGDLQEIVAGSGVVAQFGGPSYYPFSPAAGGYPGMGGSVPNYVEGMTYVLGLNYVVDPNTGQNAFEYSVNGQYAASAPGNPYFDLGAGVGIGGPGNFLGGYFQIGTVPNDPANGGTAVFSNISITPVPEPSSLILMGAGVISVLPRLMRRRA